MKKLKSRRFSALVLVFAMLLSFAAAFPVPDALAAGAWDGTVDISWYDPAKTEFDIDTPAKLAGLAALINGRADPDAPQIIGDKSYLVSVEYPDTVLVGAGGGNVSDTVYGSKVDFAYKTVRLTADLDMGGVYKNGVWSGPNWTPIGGKYPLKPSVVKGDCLVLDTRFNGVLDGQGHTVRNIFCDRYAEKGFPYSMAVGLVGFLGGKRDDDHGAAAIQFTGGWQPSVKNVIVGSGYIYGRRMVGGVVGRVGETSNGIVVENCANFADVHNTDSKGIGGIVGSGWGDGVIRNCYNAGSVTTTYTCPAGGICGSNGGLNIYNCYNTGTIDSLGQKRGRGIGGHDSGEYTVGNCYYLDGCDDDPASGGWYTGTNRKIKVDVKALTAQQMRETAFIDSLNASGTAFVADSAGINGGYPVLFFQAKGYGAAASFTVTVKQPSEGGKISADRTGAVAAGQTVALSAVADAGWTLKYFTLDGKTLDADFFTVSRDSAVSAVFYKLRQVKVTLPVSEDSYLSFSETGYEPANGRMEYVSGRALYSGDTLSEENVISVRTIPYRGATPANPNLEYTGGYDISATNAVKNPDGTFTVTGGGDVVFTAAQSTGKKSWLSAAETGWFTGESDAYTLTSAAQLAGLAYLVNVEGVAFEGVTILLGSDISLANTDGTGGTRIWEACGRNVSRHFSGTFDGRGYSVYDMTAYSGGSYAGLFGYCVGATIKNVTVRGTVTGESSMAFAAGIVAYASASTVENCVNRAVITASGTGAAGIAAYICDGTAVTGCVNRAAVSGTSGVGGIVGICYSSGDAIADCRNYGAITATGDNSYGSGGIAGQLAGSMTACGNFAAVTSADRYTGGLAGYTSSRLNSKITDSVSTGGVSSSSANRLAAVGGAVGYAQYLTTQNVSATGAVSAGAGFNSEYKGGAIGRAGAVAETGGDDKSRLPVSTADNDTWVKPPAKAVPPAENTVFRPVTVRGGEAITVSGTYYLDPGSAGEVKIAAGLTVTLNGGHGQCDGLSVNAGSGVALTLENVRLGGSGTLLTLAGGTLTLTGENELINLSDVKDNVNPTVAVSGGVIVGGTGGLYASADVGNSAVKLAPGAVLELRSGALTLAKEGLLGTAGGALFANEATVKISGGTFSGYSNSDNVSVISAKTLEITGGAVRAQAAKSPLAIEGGAVTISGGTLYVYGHTGNSAAAQKAYSGADAISGLRGAAGGTFEKPLPFVDVTVADACFDAVREVYGKGYFNGISGTEFAPDDAMTRAMFVTVLYRMAGSPKVDAGAAFTDLKQDWYRDAVAWAVAKNITSGTSATTFSPGANVTVEQAAVFLARYRKTIGKTASPVSGDGGAGSSAWARSAAAWAVENGVLQGGDDFKADAGRALLATAIAAIGRI